MALANNGILTMASIAGLFFIVAIIMLILEAAKKPVQRDKTNIVIGMVLGFGGIFIMLVTGIVGMLMSDV
jgi:hypothetical protein